MRCEAPFQYACWGEVISLIIVVYFFLISCYFLEGLVIT